MYALHVRLLFEHPANILGLFFHDENVEPFLSSLHKHTRRDKSLDSTDPFTSSERSRRLRWKNAAGSDTQPVVVRPHSHDK